MRKVLWDNIYWNFCSWYVIRVVVFVRRRFDLSNVSTEEEEEEENENEQQQQQKN